MLKEVTDEARLVCREIERRMAEMGVVTTAHYETGLNLIAEIIADREELRMACLRLMSYLEQPVVGYKDERTDALSVGKAVVQRVESRSRRQEVR